MTSKATLTTLFVSLGLGTLLVLKSPPALGLREVVFGSPPQRLTEQDLLRLSEVEPGQNLLKLPLGSVRSKLLRHPWVRDVALTRTFPGRLQISVREQVPVALLDVNDLYLINEEGEIFKKISAGDPRDLPLITGFEPKDFDMEGLGVQILPKLLALLAEARGPALERMKISEVHIAKEKEAVSLSLFTVHPVLRIQLGRDSWLERLERFERAAPVILKDTRSFRKPVLVDLTYDRRIFVQRRG